MMDTILRQLSKCVDRTIQPAVHIPALIPRDTEKVLSIPSSEPAIAFGDVRIDGKCCAIELIGP